MLMRVAVGIHKSDIDSAIATYHLLSERWFTHASPTLFNAGTPRAQMSSCFLICMKNDSIEVRLHAIDKHTAADSMLHAWSTSVAFRTCQWSCAVAVSASVPDAVCHC